MSNASKPVEQVSAAHQGDSAANRGTVTQEPAAGEMACPVCAAPMPDLKGGKATICLNCGFKDSCCF